MRLIFLFISFEVNIPVAAEAMAVLVAVHLCGEMGFQQVCLEGDAKVVVDAVNARAPVWTRWGHLVEDISLTLQDVSCWKMCFIRRAANQAARAMARMAVKQEMER